ncbi:hypothetical protein RhiirA4_451696 [Rhizophagus irregularis]|uniref:Uncharacterized protein n=1 Tax=Rhizophagus irregularis TaxID=588596 RepID=A0A2I1FWA8_9GLOM|nr:hypothetical protein RhiirA4_451696 [Rhizophagus irregularis]
MAVLSLEEALSLIPPPIIYSPGCTTSKAITKANGGPPTRVLLWEDFFGEVNVEEISEILGTYNHFASKLEHLQTSIYQTSIEFPDGACKNDVLSIKKGSD